MLRFVPSPLSVVRKLVAMKKTVLCIHVACAWVFLLSPSQAKQALSNVTQQRTTDPSIQPPTGVKSTDCPSEQASIYPSNNPAHTIQSPPARRRRIMKTAVWQDLRSHPTGHSDSSSMTVHESDPLYEGGQSYRTEQPKRPLVIEARGWTRDKQGRIHLTSRPYALNRYRVKC